MKKDLIADAIHEVKLNNGFLIQDMFSFTYYDVCGAMLKYAGISDKHLQDFEAGSYINPRHYLKSLWGSFELIWMDVFGLKDASQLQRLIGANDGHMCIGSESNREILMARLPAIN